MENGSIQVDWIKPESKEQINKENKGGIMKNVLVYVNLVIMVALVAGAVVLFKENRELQKEIKEIKEVLVLTRGVEIQDGATIVEGFEKKLSSMKATLKGVRARSERNTSEARKKIDKLERAIAETLFENSGLKFGDKSTDNVFVTKVEVEEMVQEELRKARNQRGSRRRERKSVTLDELAVELELTSEQQFELQKVFTKTEEKIVQAVFGIKDVAQMQEFKSKLANAEYDPELKKELQEKAVSGVFGNPRQIWPIFRGTRLEIRNVLGEEKYDKYRGYDVDTQSELALAVKIIRESFSSRRPRRRTSPERPSEEQR